MTRKPFIDANWFRTTQGLLALAGGVVGLLTAGIALWPKSVEPSKQYAEILLDTSKGMAEPFDGGTKMDAARKNLVGLLDSSFSSHDGLALRKFGGTCGEKDSELLLGFDKGTPGSIKDESGVPGRLMPSGNNSLVHAVAEATGDFSRIDRNSPKRLVVITGGGDRCPDQNIDDLSTRLAQFKAVGGMGLELRFVGLGLTAEDQNNLTKVAQQSGGKVLYVTNNQELERAFRQVLIVEPVISDSGRIMDILNSIVKQLNEAMDKVNKNDYGGAEALLTQAQNALISSEAPLASLKARQRGSDFQELLRHADQQRQLQRDALSVAKDIIANKKSANSEETNKAYGKYKDLADRYNSNILETKTLQAKLIKQ